MATTGGTSRNSVAGALREDASRFEFVQAIALLEQMAQGADDEAVLLEAGFGFDFPASDVQCLLPPDGRERRVRLRSNFLGLGGAHGPLPAAVSELVLERASRKDGAFQAFLGLFNHRLLALFYRVRSQARIGLGHRPPHETGFARHVFALLGLGTPGLAGRMPVPDRALLQHAGLLAGGRRTAAGLEALLARQFGVGVRLEPFTGRWLAVDAAERTAIGRTGRHRALGRGAALGGRVWDIQSAFTLALGPLTLARFHDLLPSGSAHRALVALCRFHAGPGQDCFLRLELAEGEARPGRLSRDAGAKLGWTAWLRGRAGPAPPLGIRLKAREFVA